MKLILGSKSPRRKELLELIGYEFDIKISDIDEEITGKSHIDTVKKIAMKKAVTVFKNFPEDTIICADTIVVCSNTILGKPKDINEARAMIKMLSNSIHQVYTAVVILNKHQLKEFVEETKVYVTNIDDDEIEAYINTDEPYDKAGGYGIQGIFGKFIERIEGDYYNVMGLPICKLHQELKKIQNK